MTQSFQTQTFPLANARQLLQQLDQELTRLASIPAPIETADAAISTAKALEFAAIFLENQALTDVLKRALSLIIKVADASGGVLSFVTGDGSHYELVEGNADIRRRGERAARAVLLRLGASVKDHPEREQGGFIALDASEAGFVVTLPLEAGDIRGALYLERAPGQSPFTEATIQILQQLGAYAAKALRHVRTSEVEHDSHLQLVLLNRFYANLSESLDLEQVLDRVAAVTLDVSEAERVFVLLLAGTQLYFGAARDISGPLPQMALRNISRSVCNQVLESGEGVFVYDLGGTEFHPGTSGLQLEVNSVIAIPLRTKTEMIGVIYVDARSRVITEPQRKMAAMITVSQAAAMAVESAKLYRQATVDALTGLYMRSFFMIRLEDEIRRCQRYGRTLSILVLDVDHFKRVNDTHGHQAGDDVIRSVAQLITQAIRMGVDLPGRYGGDELMILLPETDLDGACSVASRILKSVAETAMRVSKTQTVTVTVSIGIAEVRDANESANMLFARADQALYAAKQAGRNRYHVDGEPVR